MTQLRRSQEKYIRDRAKSAYTKADFCFICNDPGTKELPLDLHHFHGISHLLERWAKKNGYKLDTVEEIMAVRDSFIEEHRTEIYDDVVTLCHNHHEALHRVYGKKPLPSTAKAQARWVERQKEKLNGTNRLVSREAEPSPGSNQSS